MNGLAIGGGLLAGGLAVLIWMALARRLADDEFWRAARALSHSLASGAPPEEFFRRYAQLLRGLGRYLFKTFARVSLASIPVVAILWLIWPNAAQPPAPGRDNSELAFWAAMLAASLAAGVVLQWIKSRGRLPEAIQGDVALTPPREPTIRSVENESGP